LINKLKKHIKSKIPDIHLQELLKGTSTAMVIRVMGVGTSYMFTFLIAGLYGASAMGSFALAQTVLMITAIIARLGLDTASVRFVSENYSKGKYSTLRKVYFTILKMVVPMSMLLSIGLFSLAPVLARNILNKPGMESLIRIASFGVLPFVLLFIHSGSLRGMKKIIHYSLFRNMTTPFIGSVLLLAFFYSGFTSDKYPVFAYLISIAILSVIALVVWLKKLPKTDTNKERTKEVHLKGLLTVSLPMFFTSSMSYILQWTGLIILGIYRPAWEIGVYTVAFKVSLITGIALFAINSIAAPKFAELFSKNNMKDLENIVHQSTRLIFWTSAPFLILFLIFPTFFLGLFGQEFVFGKWTLIFFTIGQFINAISGSVGLILQMTGKQKVFLNIIITSTVINIILNVILIPKFGITGAAISSMISMVVWNLISIIMVRKYYMILTLYIPKILWRK
jgi:O-antigen/teichoic acid export membrane protein